MKDLYVYYHKIAWIYKHSHKRNKKKKKLCCEYIKCFARQRSGNNSWHNITLNGSRYFKNCRYTIKKLA